MKRFAYFLLLTTFVSACGLERDIDLKLPKYEKKLVVECYLERGKPYRLLLTESQEFLDSNPNISNVTDATVAIFNGNTEISVPYRPQIDTVSGKIYNYTSDDIVPTNATGEYRIEIRDTKGQVVTGSTRFLEVLPIKEITWEFDDINKQPKVDTAKALILMRHPVSLTNDNYRFIVNRKSKKDFANELDFIYRGLTANNGEISIGTSYRFRNNDTLQVQLFHIESQFYNYIRSVEDARDAAGNPFAQPSPIISTVKGGLGVFSTIQKDVQTIIIKK